MDSSSETHARPTSSHLVDPGGLYAWRQWFVIAVVVGVAFWGFRNVLGKQSAFPAGALDE